MAERKTDYEGIKARYGVDRLWSFSRVNSYIGCSYVYFLKYVKKLKETRTSIYSVLGTEFHDILEKYYNEEVKYEEMIDLANAVMLHVDMEDMKFDYTDAEKNKRMREKYFECVRHFFMNYKPLKAKILTEKEIVILVGTNVFFGFIDSIHKDEDGYYIITDYKSSSIYTGKKILEEGRQLLLYSMGLLQNKVPIEKIKCRWNFLKYVNITFVQKNGKPKTMTAERNGIIEKLESRLSSVLKEHGMDEFEIIDTLERSKRLNDFSLIPDAIVKQFTFEDCYVEVPVTQENFDNLTKDLTNAINEIKEKEALYGEDESKEAIWFKELKDQDTFFCANLCGYTPKQCICYKTFLDNRDMFKGGSKVDDVGEDTDWMRECGLIG